MKIRISCKDLGADCDFVARGATEKETLDGLMQHVHETHDADWFDTEEMFLRARAFLHGRVA